MAGQEKETMDQEFDLIGKDGAAFQAQGRVVYRGAAEAGKKSTDAVSIEGTDGALHEVEYGQLQQTALRMDTLEFGRQEKEQARQQRQDREDKAHEKGYQLEGYEQGFLPSRVSFHATTDEIRRAAESKDPDGRKVLVTDVGGKHQFRVDLGQLRRVAAQSESDDLARRETPDTPVFVQQFSTAYAEPEKAAKRQFRKAAAKKGQPAPAAKTEVAAAAADVQAEPLGGGNFRKMLEDLLIVVEQMHATLTGGTAPGQPGAGTQRTRTPRWETPENW